MSKAQQNQKMEALGRLAGGAAHDFINILSAIEGLVRHGAPAQEVISATRRGAGLVRRLLAFSQQGVDTPDLVDLGRELRALSPALKALFGEGVALSLDVPETPVWARISGENVVQIVMNLCLNAREATGGSGAVAVSCAARAGEAVLGVSDDGCGIAPENMARLFDPFFSTKGRGRGLGLSVVHGLAAQAGGRVEAESAPGHGARFDVILPRSAAPEGESNVVRMDGLPFLPPRPDRLRKILDRASALREARLLRDDDTGYFPE